MNENKIGPFIKKLREDKKLNQEQLANILNVHRTTIIKWEKNNAIPLNDTLVLLSEFFEVSIDEILAGERFDKDNKNDKRDEVVLSLLTKRRKLLKSVIYIAILLFVITAIFLIYYFFTTYNSLHVYRLYTSNDKPYYSSGLLVLSRDKSYIKMGTFYDKYNNILNVDKIDIYIKDENENENKILYTGSIKNLIVDFSYGIHNLKINELNSKKYDFYLKIYFDDKEEELKLYIDKDFNNNALLYNEDDILNDKSLKKTIIENIKNNKNFIYDESNFSYVYKTKNLKMEYFDELNTFRINYVKNKMEIKFVYDLLDNTLEYRKLNNYVLNDEKLINLSDIKNDEEKKIYNDFKKNYIDKYLK